MAVDHRPEDNEKIIINEFSHFLEKSKQLFNGLRELPQYGHKQWQSYFGRTFDVYTKLWKYQQQHREVLDTVYKLKRWQIGEIASKIGQLYYHYYLRTSETNFLYESFSFYSAIRLRGYYSKANKEDKSDLMVKKLRYYARYIVVCLLLKKMKLVNELVRELERQVEEYTSIYRPDDESEWNSVLHEIRTFLDADRAVEVLDDKDASPVTLPTRLTPENCPPLEKGMTSQYFLSEIIIVGNSYGQVKFSELTLDMFRMLQTLEREPGTPSTGSSMVIPGQQLKQYSTVNGDDPKPTVRVNPHKYLLYKPSFAQFNSFMAAGFKDLAADGVLLLYLSADGEKANRSKLGDDVGYEQGGVLTNNRKSDNPPNGQPKVRTLGHLKDSHCIHPGDLYPYTRKAMFVIVDSDNSSAFKNFPNLFGQTHVCLMSPEQVPTNLEYQHERGNLFTLFLHSPLTGFCHVCGLNEIHLSDWERAEVVVEKFMTEAGRFITRSRNIDNAYIQFYADDFLRRLILRFCFCNVVMRLHRGFKGARFYPSCYPSLPDSEFFDHPILQRIVMELASVLDCKLLFATADDYSRD